MSKDVEITDAAAAPAEPPRARHVRPRETSVPLQWPIEFEGKVYDSIIVRRATGAEVADFVESLRAGHNPQPPFVLCPPQVFAELDADDLEAINTEVQSFLPRALRTVLGTLPELGES